MINNNDTTKLLYTGNEKNGDRRGPRDIWTVLESFGNVHMKFF